MEWFSVIYPVLITIFLSGIVGMILLRSLRPDIVMRYNLADSSVWAMGQVVCSNIGC